MDFTSAESLLTLWVLPILALLLWRAARIEKKNRLLFLDRAMADRLFPTVSTERTFSRGLLLVIAAAFCIVALAGPRFGVYFEKVSRKGADIVVLLDTSRSMLAEDLAPNRLAAAKLDIEDLLSVVAGDRVGLIAFAGKPVIQVPLTDDFGFFRETLKKVDTKTAPRGGTAIGDAIRLALRSMKPDASRDQAILLITDGEDHESMPLEAAADAAERNVRIYTVALGDMKEGARIPLFDKKGKRTGYEKFRGQEVWSKADAELLEKIASVTGGAYLPAGTGVCDLGAFYSNALTALNRSSFGETEKRRLHEKYQIFLAIGLALLAAWLVIAPSGRSDFDEWLDRSDETVGEEGAEGSSPDVKKSRFGNLFRRALPLLAIVLLLAAEANAQNPPASEPLPADAASTDTADVSVDAAPVDAEANAPEGAKLSLPEKPSPASSGSDTAADSDTATNESAETSETKERSSKALYNEACRKMNDPESSAEAAELFDEAIRKNDDEKITALAAFNLALLTARSLPGDVTAAETAGQKALEPGDESTPPTPGMTMPPVSPNAQQTQTPPPSAVERYRAEAAEREKARQPIREKTAAADSLFRQAAAAGNRKLNAEAAQNLDLLRSWSEGQKIRWRDGERAAREKAFQPLDHLDWLEEETTRRLDAETPRAQMSTMADYQRLFDEADSLRALAGDLDALLTTTVFDEADESGAVRTNNKETLDGVFESLQSAAHSAEEYDRPAMTESLRSAAGGIDTVRVDRLDYKTALDEAIRRQEKIVERAKALPTDKSDEKLPDQIAALNWSDDFTLRRTERMIDEARREFDARPWSDDEAEQPSEPNAEANFESAEEAAAQQVPPQAGPPSPEEQQKKLRRSMKLALELGPEIVKILQDAEPKCEALDSPALAADESKTLDLLREIQKPLQDENQNQNEQQNQNQNDQQNQQQNQQDKQNQQQDNQDQQQDQQQNQPQEQQEQSSDEQKADERKSEEQKSEEQREREAEATMRKVRQRQQSAEEMRKLRDDYLRRIEKPEKDW